WPTILTICVALPAGGFHRRMSGLRMSRRRLSSANSTRRWHGCALDQAHAESQGRLAVPGHIWTRPKGREGADGGGKTTSCISRLSTVCCGTASWACRPCRLLQDEV